MQDQEYTITDRQSILYIAPEYIADPSFCEVYYSWSADPLLASVIQFDDQRREFIIYNDSSLDLVLSGTTVYPVTYEPSTGNIEASKIVIDESFQLTLNNPCTDLNYVQIESTPLPVGLEFALYVKYSDVSHDAFKVITQPF